MNLVLDEVKEALTGMALLTLDERPLTCAQTTKAIFDIANSVLLLRGAHSWLSSRPSTEARKLRIPSYRRRNESCKWHRAYGYCPDTGP
jgi:hypothetical protein